MAFYRCLIGAKKAPITDNEPGQIYYLGKDDKYLYFDSTYLMTEYEQIDELPNGFHSFEELLEAGRKAFVVECFKIIVQAIMDNEARKLGFDDMNAACSYAGYDNVFRDQAEKLGKWRADVWGWGYSIIPKYTYKDVTSLTSLINQMPKLGQ